MAGVSLTNRLLFFSLVIFQFKHTEQSIGTLITVARKVWDVADLALSITGLFDKRQDGEDASISTEQLLTELNDLIGSAKSDIIISMLDISRLERIDDTVIAVHSSMIDLRKILEETDLVVAKMYGDNFVKFYEEHDVVKHVRFLPEIITYKLPGQQFQLLSQIAATSRCNLTALAEFADFFLNLVSDGIALQVMYYKLTTSISPDRVIDDEWKDGLRKIQNELEKAEHNCVKQFGELAYADFLSSTSATVLGQSNKKRYIYNWTDAMFYAPIGTEQFHYRKHTTELLYFQKTDHQNKIAVVGSREKGKLWDTKSIEESLNNSGLAVPSKDDERAARHVGEAVEAHIKKLGYSFGAVVVYFNGNEFPERGTFKDEDSQVAFYALPGVVLEYCYDSGLKCLIRDIPLLTGGRKQAAGEFKIYVYPLEKTGFSNQTDGGISYQIGGAGIRSGPVLPVIAGLFLAFFYLFII